MEERNRKEVKEEKVTSNDFRPTDSEEKTKNETEEVEVWLLITSSIQMMMF
jgi:hypothetical protein